MASPTDVVIAGNKPFALALFAPLTERSGGRPRIAPDPAVAASLCQGSSGLLVVEYQPRWLEIITTLRQQQPALRILAALPPGQEGAAAALEALSVAVAPWDGKPSSLLPAVERELGAGRAPAPAAPPAPVAPAAATRPAEPPSQAPLLPADPADGAASGEPLDLFHDLGATEATPQVGQLATVDLEPTLPPLPGGWPSASISAVESERQLLAALAGRSDPAAPLAAVISATVASLAPLERRALTGPALEIDGEPIRRAAVLRFRMASALATRPPPGEPIDAAAVATLLAELDGLLGAINTLAGTASAMLQDQLQDVRNALVKEAVDFSEACQQVEAAAPTPTGRRALSASTRAAATRLISVQAGTAVQERPEGRRRRGAQVAILVIILLAAAGYHLQRFLNAPEQQAPRTYEGAPAGTVAIVNGGTHVLMLLPGKQLDPAEFERFKAAEQKKGNVVKPIGADHWLIEPESGPAEGAKP